MNPKFYSLFYWLVFFWFFCFGLWSVIIVTTAKSPLNFGIMLLGLGCMIYCSLKETEWFPDV